MIVAISSSSTHPVALPENVRDAIWILFASLFFGIMVVLIKFVGLELPISEILLVRQIVMLFVALPVVIPHFPPSIFTDHPWHHAALVGISLIAMFCGFAAVIHLPLADAVAIGFAECLFVTIFAIIFFREVIGIHRWAAIIIGFLGILIVLQPWTGGISLYGLLAVIGAAAAGLVMILMRYLSRFEQPINILIYQTVFVGLLVSPLAIIEWEWPSAAEMIILAAIGLVSAAAQVCYIQWFKAHEATSIPALDYVRLIWVTAFGFLIFGQAPSIATLAGAGLVIAASLYIIHREARRRQ